MAITVYTLLALYLADVTNVIVYHLVNICTFKLKYSSLNNGYHGQKFDRIVMMASADMTVKCPPDRILYPCKCHHNEHIICTESIKYSLGHVFKAISQSMVSSIHYHLPPASQFPRPLFKELVLSNKYLDELDDNLFNMVRFQRIVLVDMKSLMRIKSNTFNGTQNDVQHFEIRGENQLAIKYMNQLFDALSSLINVREMNLELNNLEMIPSYAFRDIQMATNENQWIRRIRLERLQITSRSLSQISSYAIYDLTSLRYIKIYSESGLQRISAHAFDIAQPFSHPLVIDLHSNHLTISSFEMDAFQHVNRPVHLELSYNYLISIPKNIFEHFLNNDVKNSIKLKANPLECDCNIYWLLKDRQTYINQIHDAICKEFINIWNLDENAFRKCDQNMNYMPRLIFRNSANAPSTVYQHFQSIILAFIILLFL